MAFLLISWKMGKKSKEIHFFKWLCVYAVYRRPATDTVKIFSCFNCPCYSMRAYNPKFVSIIEKNASFQHCNFTCLIWTGNEGILITRFWKASYRLFNRYCFQNCIVLPHGFRWNMWLIVYICRTFINVSAKIVECVWIVLQSRVINQHTLSELSENLSNWRKETNNATKKYEEGDISYEELKSKIALPDFESRSPKLKQLRNPKKK